MLCPGCNHAYVKAEAAGEDHSIEPVYGDPYWCGGCARRIADRLGDMVDLYAALDGDKAVSTAPEAVGSSGHHEPPSPSPQVDAQDAMTRMLMAWEDYVRAQRNMTPRPGVIPGVHNVHGYPVGYGYRLSEERTLSSAVAFLRGNLVWLLTNTRVAVDFGTGILRAHRAYQQMTGGGGGTRSMPGRCPRCELLSLVHRAGADVVNCDNPDCGRLIPWDEYDALRRK
jgi:hypothetical protein